MRVFITGVTGQDGLLLANDFLGRGDRVMGIHRPGSVIPPGLSISSNLTLASPDLIKFEEARTILDAFKPDRIFHLAAVHASSLEMKSLGDSRSSEMFDTHVTITKNILQWQESNLNSHSLIALSSQMYSPINSIQVDEETVTNPSTEYGRTKIQAWELLKFSRGKGVITHGAILFNHTSRYSKSHFIFPVLAQKIAAALMEGNKSISIRNFLSEVDMGAAFEYCQGMAKLNELDAGEDLVFSTGKLETLADITLQVISTFDDSSKFQLRSEVDETPKLKTLVGVPNKANNLIGWVPVKTPAEILIDLVKLHLESKGSNAR